MKDQNSARLETLLAHTAQQFPNRPALQTDDASLTYAELAVRVARTASELKAAGLEPGDRALLVTKNGFDDVVALLALSTVEAWPILASARAAPAQLSAMTAHCTPRLVIGASELPDAPLCARTDLETLPGVAGIRFDRSFAPAVQEPPAEDVAAIIYTSGTTGAPKAAMLSQRNLAFIGTLQRELRRYTETDKTYCPLPLAHIGALGITVCLIAAGGCLYLAERFDPAGLAIAIRKQDVTVVPGLPPLHVKFLDWVRQNPRQFDRGRVRLVTTSSSPLHLPVKRAVEDLYGCPLQNAYGLTEATGVIFQVRLDQLRDDVSVGPAIPGAEVRIADGERALGPGERGEIQVRGPNVFLGYYGNEAATTATFTADGWLRTGDIGYLSDENVAFITGRAKETIKRSGYTIYPAEVEAALNRIPGIAQAAVVAGHRETDDEVVAFVQPKPGEPIDADTVLGSLRGKIAPYEIPGAVHVIQALPTLANGKIDRVRLGQLASSKDPTETT